MNGDIIIRGASEHNLKHINVKIPRNSLTVVTGLSGSGKSSLAFDTLYAEGQRRYVESLSAYARQFLDRMQKPKVEHIEGLSPAIAIEQRSAGSNPRSTVATVTEIYDYLRLLYAHTGIPHCPKCGKELAAQSAEAICEKLLTIPEGRKMMILAPYITGRKGELRDVIEKIRRDGFVRVRVDGKITELTDEMKPLAKTLRHDIEAVVDRLVTGSLDRSRLNDSVETALKCGDGELIVMVEETDPDGSRSWKEERISERLACVDCGVSFGRMEPRNFSFNSPFGACPHCNGLGEVAAQRSDPGLAARTPSSDHVLQPSPAVDRGASEDAGHADHSVRKTAGIRSAFPALRKRRRAGGFQLLAAAQKIQYGQAVRRDSCEHAEETGGVGKRFGEGTSGGVHGPAGVPGLPWSTAPAGKSCGDGRRAFHRQVQCAFRGECAGVYFESGAG